MADLAEQHVTVHPVRPEDWRSHRDLRLEMLLDAPEAFSTQYDDVVDLTQDEWCARIAAVHHIQARIDGVPVGSAGLFDDPDEPTGTGTLVAMYVSSRGRGRGVGERLVRAVLDEAAARGHHRVVLQVTHGNEAALALYRRTGFRLTGRELPDPRRPELRELEMEHDLTEPDDLPGPAPTPPDAYRDRHDPCPTSGP